MTDVVDDLKFNKLVGQQVQRPSRSTFRRCAARQLDEVRFARAIQLDLLRPRRLFFRLKRGNKTFNNAPLPNALNRRDADIQVPSDLLVNEPIVGLEQDVSVHHFERGSATGRRQSMQLLSLRGA